MANYVINSSGTVAIRKEQVIAIVKEQYGPEDFVLVVKTTDRPVDIIIERETTQAALDAKAVTFITNLEAE